MGSADRPVLLRWLSRGIRAGLIVGVLLAAFGMYWFLVFLRVEPEPLELDERPLSVQAIRLEAVEAPRIWSGYGSVRPLRSANVSSQVAARVVHRPEGIEAGVPVRAGDVLLELDTSDFERRVEILSAREASLGASLDAIGVRRVRLSEQVEASQDELAVAERDLQRVREAADRGAATESDIDLVLTRARSAQRVTAALQQELEALEPERRRLESELASVVADRRLAEQDLSRTTIVSPIDGVLQEVSADAGELLSPGTSVARVVDLTRVEVPLRVPVSALDAGLGAVRPGDAVTLRADGPTASTWTGHVLRIAPEASSATRSATVFVEVRQTLREGAEGGVVAAGDAPLLRPGQFVTAEVVTGSSSLRLIVPRTAVNGDRVMLARLGAPDPNGDGEEPVLRATPHAVRVLHAMERAMPGLHPTATQWAVLDPLFEGNPAPGDVVIVSNLDEILPGQRVEPDVVNGRASPGAAPTAARPDTTPAPAPGGGGS
ncbi:MAG: HlyD family secretion protein [Phycisphaerales bacterium]|nr:MAG: HlyD family secretion protein [Phycisphaerales bacterium]